MFHFLARSANHQPEPPAEPESLPQPQATAPEPMPTPTALTPAPAQAPQPGAAPDDFKETDLGNAQRLVAAHGEDFRYCKPLRENLVWDGNRWREDQTCRSELLAKQVVHQLLSAAVEVRDSNERKHAILHAIKSQSASRLEAMVKLARSEPGIPILPDDLDKDPWLLNCENGTIDLRTGQIREHRKADFITHLCPVAYDPSAPCPRWPGSSSVLWGTTRPWSPTCRRPPAMR
jgi:putative DNA primase/helicase